MCLAKATAQIQPDYQLQHTDVANTQQSQDEACHPFTLIKTLFCKVSGNAAAPFGLSNLIMCFWRW